MDSRLQVLRVRFDPWGVSNIWAVLETSGPFRQASFAPVQLTTGTMNLGWPLPSLDGKKLFVVGTQQRGELVRYDVKVGQWVPYLSGISAEGCEFFEGRTVAGLRDLPRIQLMAEQDRRQ